MYTGAKQLTTDSLTVTRFEPAHEPPRSSLLYVLCQRKRISKRNVYSLLLQKQNWLVPIKHFDPYSVAYSRVWLMLQVWLTAITT